MSEYSGARLESRILEAVSTMIVKKMIKNPNLSTFTSITEVHLASDNTSATLLVSTAMEKDLDKSVEALNSAAPFIQSHIAKVLRTRNTPRLYFKADRSYQEGEKINALIDKAMGRNE
ncbi:MAG: 30S ribosome-binding factor RbfA [Sphaerochaetaceae bacterium]|nr:30S ribosome-binding factor RbfA [Sphaerochaetaceae bacterium]